MIHLRKRRSQISLFYILNYWDYQWTNAYTKSVNNQIKRIEKAGRGYKFDVLRKRCLLEINQPKPEVVNPREAKFELLSAPSAGVAEPVAPPIANHKSVYTASTPDIQFSWSDNQNGSLTKMYIESYQIFNADTAKRLKKYHDKLVQWQKERVGG